MIGIDTKETAHRLLESHWDDARGYCVPNPRVYPHLWLWDSCFHAVAWSVSEDPRGLRELDAVLAGQLPSGFVPHMRYGDAPPDTYLGPLPDISSLTQPPMYGHAARTLVDAGLPVPDSTLERCRAGLAWLWNRRRTEVDLIYVVHPWEAGNDHSPRWDDWGAPGRTPADWSRSARSDWNKRLVHDIEFDTDGSAMWSSSFVVCPAGFNAYVAYNCAELARLTDDDEVREWGERIAQAMDEHLWDPSERLWSDLAVVGGGASCSTPISDGAMGALVTPRGDRVAQVLDQLADPDRFGAPYGPANVARLHPAYDPGMYWRGAAWPVLDYLLWQASTRGDDPAVSERLVHKAVRGARASGWAEYWNPDTGAGLGAVPQTWTSVVAAMDVTGRRSISSS